MDAKKEPAPTRGLLAKLESPMALTALLLSVATSGIVVWDRFKPTKPDVTIEPIVYAQTPFTLEENGRTLESVKWEGYFTIANLSDQRIAITDFEPKFPAVEITGHHWELRSTDWTGLLKARVYEDELTLMQATTKPTASNELETYFSHRGSFPFILEAGQKRHFIFEFSFLPFLEGQPKKLKKDPKMKNFITTLIGGVIHPKEGCHDAAAPLQLVLKLSDGEVIQRTIVTRLVVVGCIGHALPSESH
jgi:hypothetical protein